MESSIGQQIEAFLEKLTHDEALLKLWVAGDREQALRDGEVPAGDAYNLLKKGDMKGIKDALDEQLGVDRPQRWIVIWVV